MQCAGEAVLRREDEGEDAQQGIDPDLGEQPGEKRGDGGPGVVIGGGQPEVEGEQPGLGREGDEEQRAGGVDELRILEAAEFHRHVGEVERAQLAVEQARAAEEHGGGQQVQDHIGEAAGELLFAPLAHHQDE